MDAQVPIKVYQSKTKNEELVEFFWNQFAEKPNFYVRVPGRVNIIGEHVDYSGYPVLPMAIDQCIHLAVGIQEETTFLDLRNVDSHQFEHFICDLQSMTIRLPENLKPEWYNYFLCGIKGIKDFLGSRFKPIGMTVVVSGNIPPAAGLSSSSALVCAAVLATAHVQGMVLDRTELANIAANCEQYIGTQGGGMDQAIAFLAKAGCAQFIEFNPILKATSIQLPEGACFVVADSQVNCNKAATSDFNCRVVECRLATLITAKRLGVPDWRDKRRICQLQDILKCNLEKLEEVVKTHIWRDSYNCSQICEELEISEKELFREFLTSNTGLINLFKLRQRALHVIQESARVAEFKSICEDGTSNGSNGHQNMASGDAPHLTGAEKLPLLSKLIRQSHASLKNLYECSHPKLDKIVSISDDFGVSARLTGAGWGGCVIALCNSEANAAAYMKELQEKYYDKMPFMHPHPMYNSSKMMFVTFPCDGAEIYYEEN